MSPNVNLKTIVATPIKFFAQDPHDPRFYIFATLMSGVLRFVVVARLPNGDRSSVSGKEMFVAMMAHFGGRIRIIEGDWNATMGLSTNLDQLNRATATGLSPEVAASLTWTGLRASEHGYNKVRIADLSGPDGNFASARVQFSR